MKECNTFIKSASYLMHYRSFTDIRNIILSKSLTIFQDDTGIPYKYFSDSDWNISSAAFCPFSLCNPLFLIVFLSDCIYGVFISALIASFIFVVNINLFL